MLCAKHSKYNLITSSNIKSYMTPINIHIVQMSNSGVMRLNNLTKVTQEDGCQ